MATVNLGRIKPVFKGAYAGGTAYVVDDIVTSGNETFICIQAGTGNATSNASYWTKLAAKGTDGTNGTDVGTTITTQGDLLYRDGSGLQRLGAGTAGQVLQTGGSGANPSWGSAGGIKQVIQTVKTASQVINSTSDVDIMSVAITPSSASSKILVSWNCQCSANDHSDLSIFRSSTQIYLGDTAGSRSRTAHGFYGDSQSDIIQTYSGAYLDSPNTSSQITYYVKGSKPASASHDLYINRSRNDLDRTNNHRVASNIMVMEVTV